VVDGRPVGLLWASPDCKHFSKAKGGKPVSKKIRGLAWVVIKWAKLVRPRIILLENVEEFQTWGPLDENNMPCPRRKGRTFKRWKASLENLGYEVAWREDRADTQGTPTIRKRLFLMARCDGQPINMPAPTHGAPKSLPVQQKKLKPFNTAASCIEWDKPAPSIFERKKPLAEATMRRIFKGIERYVINAAEPFIVPGEVSAADMHAPMNTQTTENRQALVSAFLAKHYTGVVGSNLQGAMGTVTSVDHHSLVTAVLVGAGGPAYGGKPTAVSQPFGTLTTENHKAVVIANLVHMGHGEQANGLKRWSHGIRNIEEPLNTVTASGMPAALVTSNLVKLRGTSKGAQSVDEPLHTISAGGTHHAEVRAFLIKYYGTDQDPQIEEPLHTVTTKDRFGLVTIHGQDYQIVDIGLRMLTPRELYRAQGFPESYIIDHGADGSPMTKTEQVRMCGNSVCPPMARAYVAANYREIQPLRQAA
jgi:DNA (cytosine-5)-methyltransferase 1